MQNLFWKKGSALQKTSKKEMAMGKTVAILFCYKFGFIGETILIEDALNKSLHLSATKELWGGGGIGAGLILDLELRRHRWRKGCLICTRTIWRLRLNYHSTAHEIIKFGSRADVATLPPPRFIYLLSLLFLRGGPPPLHSRKRLRSGGAMYGYSLFKV